VEALAAVDANHYARCRIVIAPQTEDGQITKFTLRDSGP
jgi:hypothetical protein